MLRFEKLFVYLHIIFNIMKKIDLILKLTDFIKENISKNDMIYVDNLNESVSYFLETYNKNEIKKYEAFLITDTLHKELIDFIKIQNELRSKINL